jgi:hypothetical protein
MKSIGWIVIELRCAVVNRGNNTFVGCFYFRMDLELGLLVPMPIDCDSHLHIANKNDMQYHKAVKEFLFIVTLIVIIASLSFVRLPSAQFFAGERMICCSCMLFIRTGINSVERMPAGLPAPLLFQESRIVHLSQQAQHRLIQLRVFPLKTHRFYCISASRP